MTDYAFLVAALAAVMFLGARREYFSNNRRDARLMAALGVTASIGSAALWFA